MYQQKVYKSDPPKSIYTDIPKKARFKREDISDEEDLYNSLKKNSREPADFKNFQVWKLKATIVSKISSMIENSIRLITY